jgi:hypothetical protein
MTDQETNEAVTRKLNCLAGPPLTNQFEQSSAVLRPYSTSIEAAWEIVQLCAKNHQPFEINIVPACEQLVRVYIRSEQTGMVIGDGEADTAPMAICLAFLKLP